MPKFKIEEEFASVCKLKKLPSMLALPVTENGLLELKPIPPSETLVGSTRLLNSPVCPATNEKLPP